MRHGSPDPYVRSGTDEQRPDRYTRPHRNLLPTDPAIGWTFKGGHRVASFTVQQTANCVVLKLCHPLDVATLGLLKMLLDAAASTTWPTCVLVDLTDCPSADITGFTVLSVLQHESHNLSVVLPTRHPLTRLLSAMHLETFLTVVESLDMAIESTCSIPERPLPHEMYEVTESPDLETVQMVAKAPRVSHGLLVDPCRMKTYRRYRKSWPAT